MAKMAQHEPVSRAELRTRVITLKLHRRREFESFLEFVYNPLNHETHPHHAPVVRCYQPVGGFAAPKNREDPCGQRIRETV